MRLPFGVRIEADKLERPFLHRPATESPHIDDHRVDEAEVIDVLEKPEEDQPGREGSGIAPGPDSVWQVLAHRIFTDRERDSVFAIAAYDPTRRPPAAFRRRRSKKHQ